MFHEEDDNTTFYDLSENMETCKVLILFDVIEHMHLIERCYVMDKSGLSDLNLPLLIQYLNKMVQYTWLAKIPLDLYLEK